MGIGVVRLKLGGGSVHHIIRLMEFHALSLACYMIRNVSLIRYNTSASFRGRDWRLVHMLQSHQIVQYVDAHAQMNASCLRISEVSTNATWHLYNFKVNVFGIHLHIQLQI